MLIYLNIIAPSLVVFKTFSRRNTITFEEFLQAASREATSDPGSAMVSVLQREKVPGINIGQITNNSGLDPQSKPHNLLRFLAHISERGQWGVNLSVRVVD